MRDQSKGRGNPEGNQSGGTGESESSLKGQVREDIEDIRGGESNPLEDRLRDRRRREILALCRESRSNFQKRNGREVLGTIPEKFLRMLMRRQIENE